MKPVQEQTVVVPTKEMVEQNMRLEELNKLRITTQTVLPPEKAAISIDGIPFFEIGDLMANFASVRNRASSKLKRKDRVSNSRIALYY